MTNIDIYFCKAKILTILSNYLCLNLLAGDSAHL
jgi:hypothetical protein